MTSEVIPEMLSTLYLRICEAMTDWHPVARVTALKHRKGEQGQGMVEYALILVLIAVVAIVALQVLGGKITSTFNYINGQLNPPPAPPPG